MRVGIIGYGSGGPAAACFLAYAGHEVVLFERARARAPVGAGFLLRPTGQRVLAELGILDATLRHGGQVDRLLSRTSGGRTLLDLRYQDLVPGSFGIGVHRATLLRVLDHAARQRGVTIRMGCEIRSLESAADGVRVTTEAGPIDAPFELVVIANGAQSALRDAVGVRWNARPYPWGALWTIVPDRAGAFSGELFQVTDGVRRMVGFLDTGYRLDRPEDGPLVSIFWSIEGSRVTPTRERGGPALREQFPAMAPRAEVLLGDGGEIASRDIEAWTHAAHLDVRMPCWHGRRVAIMSDAAHATSPQLGQGVNLALLDAWVLAHASAREPDLDRALVHYSRRRRAHLRFYQRAARWLTPFFQSSFSPASWLRDAALPVAQRVPWLRREMTRAMAGTKLGFLRGSLALDAP